MSMLIDSSLAARELNPDLLILVRGYKKEIHHCINHH